MMKQKRLLLNYIKMVIIDELLEDLLGVKTIWYEQNITNKWKKKEDILIEPDYKIKSINVIKWCCIEVAHCDFKSM